MGYTFDEALSKIGTPGYSGVDGLIKLVQETSTEIRNAAPNATRYLAARVLSDKSDALPFVRHIL